MTTHPLIADPELPGYPCAWSPCRRYRYTLWRRFGPVRHPRYLMVVGLNPSTADETHDDRTVRRCMGFAGDWGFDALCVTNLFAFRATDPRAMKAEMAQSGRRTSPGSSESGGAPASSWPRGDSTDVTAVNMT
jgi:hypothetical protein